METYAIVLLSLGCVIVVYTTATAILLRAPPLPWTKRSPQLGFQARNIKIAHRGGSLIGPENTLLTFRKAAEHPHVDMLELDVCITADGVVVVAHDDELGRTCHRPGQTIHETNYADLPKLARSIRLHFTSPTVDTYHMPEAEFEQHGLQPFCMLKELFDALPETPMHVDCKHPSEPLVREVVRLVRQYQREHITVVGAASNPNAALVQALKTAPGDGSILEGKELITFASAKAVVFTIVTYYLGLLPLVPFSYDVFDIPLPTPQLKKQLDGMRCSGLFGWLLYTPKLWAHLRRRGVLVYGFVLNSREDVEYVADWPIDGIMTDDPAIFGGIDGSLPH